MRSCLVQLLNHFKVANMRRIILLVIFIVCSLLLNGCYFKEEAVNVSSNTTMVENFSFYGDPQKMVIKSVPNNVLVCSTTAVDTLIALGAGQHIKAAVLTEGASREKYMKALPNAKIYSHSLQLEAVTEMQPDMIIGWRRFFSDIQLGNSTNWINKGIPAYIQDASGPIPSKGKFPRCTVESEINFIRNMGVVFDCRNEAENIIRDIKNKFVFKESGKKRVRVLVVEFINGSIEVFGSDLLIGDIINRLGGSVVEYGNPFVSQEVIVSNDADYIFVVYHGGETDKNAAMSNFDKEIYRNMPAVLNKKIYPLNYNLIVAPAVNLLNSVEYIKSVLK